MADKVNSMMERAARRLAARHYAYRFGQPEEHPMVTQNVDGNWRDFLGDADAAISSLVDPDHDTTAAVVKATKDRTEAVTQWNAMIAAIVG